MVVRELFFWSIREYELISLCLIAPLLWINFLYFHFLAKSVIKRKDQAKSPLNIILFLKLLKRAWNLSLYENTFGTLSSDIKFFFDKRITIFISIYLSVYISLEKYIFVPEENFLNISRTAGNS